MKTKQLFLALIACGLALGARAQHLGISLRIGAPPPVVVREAPPRRVIVEERRAPQPGANYVWVNGHYAWTEGRWVWIEGAWIVPPQPDALWVDGRWDPQSQNWIEGHWEVRANYAAQPSIPPPPSPGYSEAAPAPGPTVETEIFVNEAPPPPRHEEIIERDRPSREAVWITGYWNWDHGRHQWVSGHWERPPRAHATWVEPRWEHRGNGYVFVKGYWR